MICLRVGYCCCLVIGWFGWFIVGSLVGSLICYCVRYVYVLVVVVGYPVYVGSFTFVRYVRCLVRLRWLIFPFGLRFGYFTHPVYLLVVVVVVCCRLVDYPFICYGWFTLVTFGLLVVIAVGLVGSRCPGYGSQFGCPGCLYRLWRLLFVAFITLRALLRLPPLPYAVLYVVYVYLYTLVDFGSYALLVVTRSRSHGC